MYVLHCWNTAELNTSMQKNGMVGCVSSAGSGHEGGHVHRMCITFMVVVRTERAGESNIG